MSHLLPLEKPLDQHAASLAWSLSKQKIKYEITQQYDSADEPKKYWLRFTINHRNFSYRVGILKLIQNNSKTCSGVNINHRAELLVANKHLTKQHLAEHGLNVPKGKFFRRRLIDQAYEYFNTVQFPLCVKPNNGRMGQCVTSSIHTFSQYEKAINRVAQKYANIVVEEHVDGEHFRFFYVEPKIIAIRQGIALSVVGDGVNSIATLLTKKNLERAEKNLVTHPEVQVDQPILDYLAAQNLTPDSIPQANERIFLRSSAGHSEAADTIILPPHAVHSDYLEIVEKACKSVPGLYYSGIDIVIKNSALPATNDNYWIIELNANPGLSPYYFPWTGDKIDVAIDLIELLRARDVF